MSSAVMAVCEAAEPDALQVSGRRGAHERRVAEPLITVFGRHSVYKLIQGRKTTTQSTARDGAMPRSATMLRLGSQQDMRTVGLERYTGGSVYGKLYYKV